MKNKRGVSLIVLVITIIVMIILAAAAIISLTDTNLIDRAGEANDEFELKQVQNLAALAWSDAYTAKMSNPSLDIKNEVILALERQGVSTEKYRIEVDNKGVTVYSKAKSVGNEIVSGQSQLTLSSCAGDPLNNYKIYGNTSYSALPSEYKQVAYLESSTTQYIDLKYKYVVNDEINIEFMKTSDNGLIQGVFGHGNQAPWIGTVLYINGTNNLTSTIGGTLGLEFFKYTTALENNVRYTVKYQGKSVYLNNSLIITVGNTVIDGTQEDFSLFRRYGTNGMNGRIYSFNIKRNNEYVINMVPCRRVSDGELGMYDYVSKKFYTNNGTGTFTAAELNPTVDSPVQLISVGEYDSASGKYKIPVKVNDGKNVVVTNIYLDEPLRKIDEYADYIDFENKKVVRRIASEYFNTVNNASSYKDSYKKFLSNIKYEPLLFEGEPGNTDVVKKRGIAISNKFNRSDYIYERMGNYPNLIQTYITSAGDNRVVYTFDDTTITTIEQAQAKIGDGFEVCYVMKNPIEQTIDLPKISTLKGDCTLSIETTLKPSNVEVEYTLIK